MVEIQAQRLLINLVDAGIHRLPGLVFHLDLSSDLRGNILWKITAWHIHKSLIIFLAISISGGDHTVKDRSKR